MKDLQEIIAKCKKQDTRAEYALYKLCFTMLMPICYRYSASRDDALDLLNKGFYKILKNITKYKEELEFSKWAKTILINSIIDEFRMAKKYKESQQVTDFTVFNNIDHPFDINKAEQKLSAEEVISQIGKLPNMSKEVMNLYVFEGLSHREISVSLNISEGTSRWHLSNARSILKEKLGNVLSSLKMLIL